MIALIATLAGLFVVCKELILRVEEATVFDATDALVQVGGGSVLLLLFLEWAGVVGMLCRRKHLHPAWWAGVAAAGAGAWYAWHIPVHYVSDIAGFRCR